MGPREARPRPAWRDGPPWTWRLSGQRGGTGTGWAVTQKTQRTAAPMAVPRARVNPALTHPQER